jgi:hypothetical protein
VPDDYVDGPKTGRSSVILLVRPEARDPEGTGSPVVKLFFGAVTLIGLATMLVMAYLIVRGPFLGGPLLSGGQLFAALGGFLVGIIAFTWGGARAVDVGSRM